MRFPTTLPLDAPDLDRVSDFAGWLQEQREREDISSDLAELSASLWQDLWCASPSPGRNARQDSAPAGPAGHWRDVVEALAASLRHAQALTLYLGGDTHVLPLTLYPLERLVRCPLDQERFASLRLAALRVLHVEPAMLRAPDPAAAAAASDRGRCRPLAPIGWMLALRGPRREVLPELAGALACRRVPGLPLQTPGVCGAMTAALERLGQESASLRTIASWHGMDAARAARLINGLYLQGALIVSRTHPAARER